MAKLKKPPRTKPRTKDNAWRFRRESTVYITKYLEGLVTNIANDIEVNVKQIIADKMEETYKDNIRQSYTPRSAKGYETMLHNADPYNTHKRKITYHHTNTLVDSVSATIKGKYVSIKIDGRRRYKKFGENRSIPVTQVYEWLTQGTKTAIGQNYAYTAKDGKVYGGRNWPTEKHDFNLWTQLEMNAFVKMIESEIKSNPKKYLSYRYTGKKTPRKTYKGQDVRQSETAD